MKAILRPASLFTGMYLTSAVAITVATGSMETALVTATATSVMKFLVAHVHHMVWHRIDHKAVPEATLVDCQCGAAMKLAA